MKRNLALTMVIFALILVSCATLVVSVQANPYVTAFLKQAYRTTIGVLD